MSDLPTTNVIKEVEGVLVNTNDDNGVDHSLIRNSDLYQVEVDIPTPTSDIIWKHLDPIFKKATTRTLLNELFQKNKTKGVKVSIDRENGGLIFSLPSDEADVDRELSPASILTDAEVSKEHSRQIVSIINEAAIGLVSILSELPVVEISIGASGMAQVIIHRATTATCRKSYSTLV